MTDDGGCCLGWYCEADGLEKKLSNGATRYSFFGGCWASDLLPPLAEQRLGITADGRFTIPGRHFARIFLRENNVRRVNIPVTALPDLTSVNDGTNADHSTIGALIKHLAWVERTLNIKCFTQP